jgi:hypothetical protein
MNEVWQVCPGPLHNQPNQLQTPCQDCGILGAIGGMTDHQRSANQVFTRKFDLNTPGGLRRKRGAKGANVNWNLEHSHLTD